MLRFTFIWTLHIVNQIFDLISKVKYILLCQICVVFSQTTILSVILPFLCWNGVWIHKTFCICNLILFLMSKLCLFMNKMSY